MKANKFVMILVILMLGSLLNVYSQKEPKKLKCKYDVEKKDEFTGADYKSVKIRMTVKQNLTLMMYNFEFFKNGTDYTLQVNYPLMGNIRDIIPKGEEMLIKLANGEMLKLYVAAETVPAVQISGESIYTTYMIKFPIAVDDITKMSTSYPTNYKFAIGSLNVQNVIEEKDGEKLSNVCKCLLQ